MKNMILTVLSICFAGSVFAQMQNPTVSIICQPGSGDCLFTDPNPNISYYEANINDGDFTGGNGWSRSSIKWDPMPANSFTSALGDGTEFYSLKWNNAPNTPSRRMKVTVTYKKAGEPDKVVFDEKVVTVKHIGPITSMNIPGASPATVSNGAATSLPCGTSSLTISVATPATSPVVTVIYDWDLPSGWTGSSTTNTITVTPSAGATDQTIFVNARRSDGNVFSTFSANITRPRVTNAVMESVSWSPFDKPLCSSETRQLTGASTVNATTFSWSVSGGTSIVGASNQATVTVQGTSNGNLTLTASNACGVPKTRTRKIFAGTPQISNTDVLVDGHPNYYPNYTTGSSYINIINGSSCQTYKWSLFSGSGSFSVSGSCSYCGNNFNGINFNQCGTASAYTTSSMALRVQSANRCGQGVDVIIPFETSGGGGYYYRLASPNPGRDQVSIEFDPKQAKKDLKMVRMISHDRSNVVRDFNLGQARKSNYFDTHKQVSFDVLELPRGIYHVIMKFGPKNETFTEMIILE